MRRFQYLIFILAIVSCKVRNFGDSNIRSEQTYTTDFGQKWEQAWPVTGPGSNQEIILKSELSDETVCTFERFVNPDKQNSVSLRDALKTSNSDIAEVFPQNLIIIKDKANEFALRRHQDGSLLLRYEIENSPAFIGFYSCGRLKNSLAKTLPFYNAITFLKSLELSKSSADSLASSAIQAARLLNDNELTIQSLTLARPSDVYLALGLTSRLTIGTTAGIGSVIFVASGAASTSLVSALGFLKTPPIQIVPIFVGIAGVSMNVAIISPATIHSLIKNIAGLKNYVTGYATGKNWVIDAEKRDMLVTEGIKYNSFLSKSLADEINPIIKVAAQTDSDSVNVLKANQTLNTITNSIQKYIELNGIDFEGEFINGNNKKNALRTLYLRVKNRQKLPLVF